MGAISRRDGIQPNRVKFQTHASRWFLLRGGFRRFDFTRINKAIALGTVLARETMCLMPALVCSFPRSLSYDYFVIAADFMGAHLIFAMNCGTRVVAGSFNFDLTTARASMIF